MVHRTCRSCHVPPPEPPSKVLTDCAVCHVPERAPESLFLLLSDGAMTLSVTFPETIGPEAGKGFRDALLGHLERSRAEVRPPGSPASAPVEVRVFASSGEGRAPSGAAFHAARTRAEVRLHRARVDVESRPAVKTSAADALSECLADLAERVALVLSY